MDDVAQGAVGTDLRLPSRCLCGSNLFGLFRVEVYNITNLNLTSALTHRITKSQRALTMEDRLWENRVRRDVILPPPPPPPIRLFTHMIYFFQFGIEEKENSPSWCDVYKSSLYFLPFLSLFVVTYFELFVDGDGSHTRTDN